MIASKIISVTIKVNRYVLNERTSESLREHRRQGCTRQFSAWCSGIQRSVLYLPATLICVTWAGQTGMFETDIAIKSRTFLNWHVFLVDCSMLALMTPLLLLESFQRRILSKR